MDQSGLVSEMMTPSGTRVSLSGVFKHYGSRSEIAAVEDVSLSVDPGELLTLLGPSGSGKTTILRILAGLEMPDKGSILIDDVDVTDWSPQRRNVGVVFQNYALFPHMSVERNVAFALEVKRRPKGDVRSAVKSALATVKLSGLEDRYPAQLSGGQQQRVAIARTLVYEPQLLLMDEPLGALDKNLREHMQVELRELQQRLGLTCIFVTHDQDEAMALSDRIALLRSGRVVQVGTPAELYRSPTSAFVAGFFGKVNFIEGRLRRSASNEATVETAVGNFDVYAQDNQPSIGAAVILAFRPEDVRIGPLSTGGQNLRMRVRSVRYAGPVLHIYGVLNDRVPVVAHVEASRQRLEEGMEEWVHVPPERLLVFESDGPTEIGARLQSFGS